MYEAANKFNDDQFLKKTGLPQKLKVWDRHFNQGINDVFENLSKVAKTSASGAITVIPCIKQHIYSLGRLFQKHFPNSRAPCDWVMDLFSATGWCILVFYFID